MLYKNLHKKVFFFQTHKKKLSKHKIMVNLTTYELKLIAGKISKYVKGKVTKHS